jgi:hypothetical protein
MEADKERLTDPRPVKKNASSGLKTRDIILAVIALAIIAAIARFIILDREAPQQPPMIGDTPVAPAALEKARRQLNQPQAPAPQLTDADLAPIAPPEQLDSSDAQVSRALEEMAPQLLAWLTPKEQVRKWVAMAANLSDGDLVSKNRPLAYPMEPFQVSRENGSLTMSNANFERTKDLIDGVTTIPPAKLAAYYRQWSPTLEKAYTELGMDGNFHAHFVSLVDRALATPTLSKPPKLSQPHVLYTYSDEELEQASDLNKLMWRLGPDNMAKLQAYLRELKMAL